MHNDRFNFAFVKVEPSAGYMNIGGYTRATEPNFMTTYVRQPYHGNVVPQSSVNISKDLILESGVDRIQAPGYVHSMPARCDNSNHKILVNPHFRKTVHVNPNFTQHAASKEKNIHVNPKITHKLWRENVTQRVNVHLNPHVVMNSASQSGCKVQNNIHINPNIMKRDIGNDSTIMSGNVQTFECSDNIVQKEYEGSKRHEINNPDQRNKLVGVINHSNNISDTDKVIKRNYMQAKDKSHESVCSTSGSVRDDHIVKQRDSIKTKYKIVRSTLSNKNSNMKCSDPHVVDQLKKQSVSLSKYKLIKSVPPKNVIHNIDYNSCRKQRNSLQARYKIVRSTCLQKPSLIKLPRNIVRGQQTVFSRYKINRLTQNSESQYRLDKRSRNIKKNIVHEKRKRRYVYIDQFFNIGNLARNMLIKQYHGLSRPGYINVNGILYKKSPNSLRKTNSRSSLVTKINKSPAITPFKFIRSVSKVASKSQQINQKSPSLIKTTKLKKNSPSKLRKSNVPCPIYRRFGRCKGKDNGKCIRIHNPNQIILCTKFLQGACVYKNCLLSHKISPEKMPTCKYYLEGSCSREDCQYLHVKISPKAEICRDFLEGFCERAAQCDKRHQFLCPDFEKNGTCPKKRCEYPHGEWVRKIDSSKKFAKKCSQKNTNKSEVFGKQNTTENLNADRSNQNSDEKSSGARYFENQDQKCNNIEEDLNLTQLKLKDTQGCESEGIRIRTKLGDLPSYIPLFEEKS